MQVGLAQVRLLPVLLVLVAVGAVGAVVVVDVMVIVADPIVSSDCFIKGKVLRSHVSVVGVMRGTQGSHSSLCVLPGLLSAIVAGAYLKVSSGSLLSSVVVSSTPGSSGWASSTILVACTSGHTGPKNGL